MDLLEVAQLLGNLGEFFGAIAVVVTLGYLVVQVRQNTRMLRSSVYGSWVDTASKTHMMLADHAELYGSLYRQSDRQFDDLNPTEVMAHQAMFVHTMNAFEAAYLNYVDGAIDQSIFEAKHRSLAIWLGGSNLSLETWERWKPGPWDYRFVEYIDTKILPEINPS